MDGGKLLGKGGYGCVFSPAIRCKGQSVSPPGIVSKAMERTDADEEYAYHVRLRGLDPEKRLFVTASIPPCEPDQTPQEALENPTKGCGKTILQLPFAGESWETFWPGDKMAFFRSWMRIFDAVELLHANRLAHMDIKAENIVTNDLYKNRLIDFGFMFSPEFFPETKEYMDLFTRVNYYPWPYEVKFLNTAFDLSKITNTSIAQFYRKSVSKHSGTYPSDIYYSSDGKMILDGTKAKTLYSPIVRLSRPEQLLFLSRAIDVYSLGRVLSRLYVKLTGHIPRYGTVVLESEGSQNFLLFPKHPDFRIIQEQSIPFFHLIRDMMNLNPFKRISISDAKERFYQLPFFDGVRLPPPSLPLKAFRTLSSVPPLPPSPKGGTRIHMRKTGVFTHQRTLKRKRRAVRTRRLKKNR